MPMSWEDRAACRGMPLTVFFPDRGQRYGYREAERVCDRCPVARQCYEFAQEMEVGKSIWERAGMYGGTKPIHRVLADDSMPPERRRRIYAVKKGRRVRQEQED